MTKKEIAGLQEQLGDLQKRVEDYKSVNESLKKSVSDLQAIINDKADELDSMKKALADRADNELFMTGKYRAALVQTDVLKAERDLIQRSLDNYIVEAVERGAVRAKYDYVYAGIRNAINASLKFDEKIVMALADKVAEPDRPYFIELIEEWGWVVQYQNGKPWVIASCY